MRILKIYEGATEEQKTETMLRCEGRVRLDRRPDSFISYYIEIDAEGDAFVGYRIGDPIPTPTPVPTPTPLGHSVETAIPVGSVLTGSDGTEIRAVTIVEDATDVVFAENQFNDPPAEDNRFLLVRLELTLPTGNESVRVSEADFSLTGDTRTIYDWTQDCGIIPNEIGGEVLPQGRIQGDVCFEIPASETGLILIHSPGYRSGADRYLRIYTAGTGPAPLAPPAPGRTLDDPIAVGGVLTGFDGSELRVVNIVEDAADAVLAENSYNDPPAEGNRFLLVKVEVSLPTGDEAVAVGQSVFGLIGDDRTVYDWSQGCGIIPDEIGGEILPQGRLQGNVCFEIPAAATGLVLIHSPGYGPHTARYLRLYEQGEGPAPLAPPPPGRSLDDPVAAGEALVGTDGTEIRVLSVTEDATAVILAENQFNDPPEEGDRYYMVRVEVSNISGDSSLTVSAFDFELIGNARTVYSWSDHRCGYSVIPDALDGEIFQGGSTQGNVCFQIPIVEAGLILIHKPGYDVRSRRFLALP